MLTRAKLLTVIIGNVWTLCDAKDSKGLWYELLQELSTRECVLNEKFETIVLPSHEKDTPHDDTWKLRRRSNKKKNGKDDMLAARNFEKKQRPWVLNQKDREELWRRFFGVQESLSKDDLMHYIVQELLMRPYRHGGKGVDRWKMEPKLLDLKCWSYKGETHNVAAPCDETNYILHLTFQVILRNLPLWPSTIPANIKEYLENPPKTDEAWEVCADVPEAILGVLEPVDHQAQIFRTFLTEQYNVDCSKERIFQSRHHIDVLTETIRWMVYYGNISVQEILSKLPQKKTFGPTSLPRKTDAPPHPFLTPKERARKADSQEPATYPKTAKWNEMRPDYIKHVGWPLPWPESNSVSSRPGSSWEVYGTGNNAALASAQWVTRKPANIDFDGEITIDFPRNAKDVKYVATPAKKIIRAMIKATLWIQPAEQNVKTERNCGNKVFSTPHGSVRYASLCQLRPSRSEEIKDLNIRRFPECAHFDTQSATDHRTSAATGHEKSTATGHRISAATGHRTSTATGQWQRAKNVSGHGSCRVSP